MKVKRKPSIQGSTGQRTRPTRLLALSTVGNGILALTAAVLFILAACSTVSPPPQPEGQSSAAYEEGVPGGVIVNTLEVSARVAAIDNAKRKVTLLGPDGDKFTVAVGPEAVNFDQIKVGDLVKATLTEELVVFMDDADAPAAQGEAGVVALAPKGAQPGGLAAQTTQVVGTVIDIDRIKRTATLRFDDGSIETFPVRPDIDLSRHEVGERVVFRVTEMVALSVVKQ